MRVPKILRALLVGLVTFVVIVFLVALIGMNVGIYRAGPPHRGILVLRGGTLIDGTGREPIRNVVVVIKGNRIERVGSGLLVPPEADVIEVQGLTLLPGLIDCHVHLGGPIVERREDVRKPWKMIPDFWDYLRQMTHRRRLAIENGVTTVKSVGDVHPQILELRDAIAAGKLEGPRIFAVGPIFTAPGGHPAGTIYRGNPWLITRATRQVSDPEAARREVVRLAGEGVDGIKVVYSGPGELPRLRRDVLEAIVDEAHKHELRVVAHTRTADEVKEVIEAGVDGLEHGLTAPEELTEDLIQLMRERGLYYVPTLQVHGSQALPRVQANLRRLSAGGVKIALGTDANNPGRVNIGTGVHKELELMVAAGLQPMEAILAATKNAAEHLGKGNDLGTIEPGKFADLIAVSGDPLKTIGDVRNIRLVIKGGKVLVRVD